MSDYIKGCLPRTTKVGDGTFKVFGTDGTPPVIPNWRDLPDVIDPSLIHHIINQEQQGSCCACMGCGAVMLARNIAGLDPVILSQASLYGLGNGGSDNGMAIDTCLEILMEQGACTIETIGQYAWKEFRRAYYPDGHPEGQRYTIEEAWDCTTIDHVGSAYKSGYPVEYGAKGHAVFRIGDNLDVNSWGRNWGNNGLGEWVSERTLASEIKRYGAWALRVATDPDNDGDLPQPKVN